MNLKIIGAFILLALLVSSCGAPATPTPMSNTDVENTAIAGAFTALAETHIALPTNTFFPPTETPTQTLVPSNTPKPRQFWNYPLRQRSLLKQLPWEQIHAISF